MTDHPLTDAICEEKELHPNFEIITVKLRPE